MLVGSAAALVEVRRRGHNRGAVADGYYAMRPSPKIRIQNPCFALVGWAVHVSMILGKPASRRTLGLWKNIYELVSYVLEMVKNREHVLRLGHLDGVKPGHENVMRPGHLDSVKPGHENVMRPGHLDGVKPGHENVMRRGNLDGVKPGHENVMRPGHLDGVKPGLQGGFTWAKGHVQTCI